MIQLNTNLDPVQIIEIRLRLHNAGLRSTTARMIVLNILLDASEPVAHAEISSDLNLLGFDKSTIYRNLSDLCKANLIAKIHLPGDPWKYQIASSEIRDPMHSNTDKRADRS